MVRIRFAFACLGVLLAASGCATTQKLDAASDIHAFLIAIRDNDRVAFEAHIDRPALQSQIEDRLLSEARRAAPSGALADLAQAVAGPLAQFGSQSLIRPNVFRTVAVYLGYDPAKPLPNQLVIANSLRHLDDGRVCAPRRKDGPCMLTFTHEEGAWKLTSFDGEIGDLNR